MKLALYKDSAEKRELTICERQRLDDEIKDAANAGDNEKIRALLDKGANIWGNVNSTPLIYAANRGRINTCIFLLEEVARIGGDTRTYMNAKNTLGRTATEAAAFNGKTETALFLRLYSILMDTGKSKEFRSLLKACAGG